MHHKVKYVDRRAKLSRKQKLQLLPDVRLGKERG